MIGATFMSNYCPEDVGNRYLTFISKGKGFEVGDIVEYATYNFNDCTVVILKGA